MHTPLKWMSLQLFTLSPNSNGLGASSHGFMNFHLRHLVKHLLLVSSRPMFSFCRLSHIRLRRVLSFSMCVLNVALPTLVPRDHCLKSHRSFHSSPHVTSVSCVKSEFPALLSLQLAIATQPLDQNVLLFSCTVSYQDCWQTHDTSTCIRVVSSTPSWPHVSYVQLIGKIPSVNRFPTLKRSVVRSIATATD